MTDRDRNLARSGHMRVAVVVPTYNEADNLPILVRRLSALDIDGLGFVIVDDDSPDGTGDVADRLAAEFEGAFRVIHRQAKDGLGRAYVAGFKVALDENPDAIVEMDADLSHPPSEVPAMLAKLGHTDVVVGSRYVRGGQVDSNWNIARRLLSRAGGSGIRRILRLNVMDTTSGFKAFTADALRRIDPDSLQFAGFGFQAEVAYRCQIEGLRIVEHPYRFSQRSTGSSKMSATIVAEAILRLTLLRFRRPTVPHY